MADSNNYSGISRLFQNAGSNQTQQGTGYTNLNRLFDANKDNKLGEKVAGDVSSQLTGVKTQLQQQQDKFKDEAEKNRLDTDQNKQQRDAVIGRFSASGTSGGELDDKDVEAFGKFRAGEYGGPTELGDTTNITNAASGLASQVSNYSPAGTQELLRRSVGGNRYSQGQSRLDSLLLDKSALTPIQRQSAGLGQEINKANLGAQGQAQLYRNQAQQFGKETTDQLTGALGSLNSEVQNQFTQAQAAEADRLARIQNVQDFANNRVTKKDANGKALTDVYGNVIYDTTAQARGTGDTYDQLNTLSSLLSSNGANQEELSKLFGSGGFEGIRAGEAALQGQRDALLPALRRAQDEATWTYDNERMTQTNQKNARNEAKRIQDQINSIKINPNEYLSRGLAGEALQKGNTEGLYGSLAASLANSKNATNLTEEGVASDEIRNNYTALQKLMGADQAARRFSDDAERYEAGNFLLNPDLIRKAII